MVALGRVQNGVVVLDEGTHFPEGQRVTVYVADTDQAPGAAEGVRPHSVLDIPSVSLGKMLRPLPSDDDLLGDMLESRS